MRTTTIGLISIIAQSSLSHASPPPRQHLFDQARGLYDEIGTGEHFYFEGTDQGQMGLTDVPSQYLRAIYQDHTNEAKKQAIATLTWRDLIILKRCHQQTPSTFHQSVINETMHNFRGNVVATLMYAQNQWLWPLGLGFAGIAGSLLKRPKPKQSARRQIKTPTTGHIIACLSSLLVVSAILFKASYQWFEPWLLHEPPATNPSVSNPYYQAYTDWRHNHYADASTPSFVHRMEEDLYASQE